MHCSDVNDVYSRVAQHVETAVAFRDAKALCKGLGPDWIAHCTATTCWRVSDLSAATNRSAIHPGPTMPQRKGGTVAWSGDRG